MEWRVERRSHSNDCRDERDELRELDLVELKPDRHHGRGQRQPDDRGLGRVLQPVAGHRWVQLRSGVSPLSARVGRSRLSRTPALLNPPEACAGLPPMAPWFRHGSHETSGCEVVLLQTFMHEVPGLAGGGRRVRQQIQTSSWFSGRWSVWPSWGHDRSASRIRRKPDDLVFCHRRRRRHDHVIGRSRRRSIVGGWWHDHCFRWRPRHG